MNDTNKLVKQIKRNHAGNPNWKPGQSGNPNGRPRVPEIEELREAIRIARKRHGNKSILVHFVEKAYTNDQVLIALAKKLIPDKISGELKGNGFGDTTIHIHPNKVLIFKDLKEDDANLGRTDNLHVPEGTASNRTEGKV
jgi:hypothetical protein